MIKNYFISFIEKIKQDMTVLDNYEITIINLVFNNLEKILNTTNKTNPNRTDLLSKIIKDYNKVDNELIIT
jgi:hypothetical protein